MPENLRVVPDPVYFHLPFSREFGLSTPSDREAVDEPGGVIGTNFPQSDHVQELLPDLPNVGEQRLCDGSTDPVDFGHSSFLFPPTQRETAIDKRQSTMPGAYYNLSSLLVIIADEMCKYQVSWYQHTLKMLMIEKERSALLREKHLETIKKINETARTASTCYKVCTYFELLFFAFGLTVGGGLMTLGVNMRSYDLLGRGLCALAGVGLSMFSFISRENGGSTDYSLMLNLAGGAITAWGGAGAFALIAHNLPTTLAESIHSTSQLLKALLNFKLYQTKSTQHLFEQCNTKTTTEMQKNNNDIKEMMGKFERYEGFDLCITTSDMLQTLVKITLIKRHK